MVYVYLIQSAYARDKHYVGITGNLRQRLADHNAGLSPHTSKFIPWNLVANFAFADRGTGFAFEKYLKSGSGAAFLRKRFLGCEDNKQRRGC